MLSTKVIMIFILNHFNIFIYLRLHLLQHYFKLVITNKQEL